MGAVTCGWCAHSGAHGWWGDPKVSHCRVCHWTWTGFSAAHCPTCHEHFTSDSGYETHLRRGADGKLCCRVPAEMRRGDHTHVYTLSERGWRLTPTGATPFEAA